MISVEKKGLGEHHQVAARIKLLPESKKKIKNKSKPASKSGDLFTV